MSDDKVRKLQDTLTDVAKSNPKRKFYSLRDKLYRIDVLERAWDAVLSNRGAPGPDGVTTAHIKEQGIEAFLLELQEELRTGTYRPGPVLRVYIPKPNGKERPLGIPNIRDRVVQAAVKLVIEPIFEADFLPFSFGFRPGRSARDATEEIYKWLNFGYENVLDADIEKCFDEIPHDKLLRAVGRRVSDRYVLKLISMWLKSPILENGELRKSRKGTPQGGVISPLLANIYLHQLDHKWVGRGMTRRSGPDAQMVRYADDIVVLSKKTLEVPIRTLRDILSELGLRLSETKTQVTKAERGFEFLGFRFTRRYSPKHGKVLSSYFPSPKSVKRVKGRIREIAGNDRLHTPPEEVAEDLNLAVTGWCEYFKWSWHGKAFSKVYEYLRYRFKRFLRRRQNKPGLGRYRDLPERAVQSRYGLRTRWGSMVFNDQPRRDCSGRAV